MSENHEDTPDAVRGLNAESDVVARRSGAETSTSGRPIPADPPEAQAGPSPADAEEGGRSDRPREPEEPEQAEETEQGTEPEDAVTEKEVRPDVGPTG
ncbi:MAG: hypothetical protein K0R62_5169 [Nonomuraea muscovyensis]|nr:hypothetical protein [Nonomuraea muscovyensis]